MYSRRTFIKQSTLISLGFLGLQRFTFANSSLGDDVGFGPLLHDPKGILKLPKGFSYSIISKKGSVMSDGFFLPGAADGMATFLVNGKTVLIRNHELSPGDMEQGPFGAKGELVNKLSRQQLYDFGKGKKIGVGGTTTLVFDEKNRKVEKEFLSLTGTVRNCAGGRTPWDSWITCEETSLKPDGELEKQHGYNFEVKATTEPSVQTPTPLKAMGRFVHEAVAVDPSTGIVYQTEDAGDGLIYRFIPEKKGDLSKGRLQALKIAGRNSAELRNWKPSDTIPVGKHMEVEWMDLTDIDAPDDDLRLRGFEAGAARFARGEGMWYGNSEVYFACTNGGSKKNGQIFKYKPSPFEGTEKEKEQRGTLELFIESEDADILQHADNLTVSPWGDLIVCEDKSDAKIVGVTPEGKLYHFAENIGYKSEFTGACFSPSGQTLFVNIQVPGLTLAIQGPWRG